MVYRPTPITPKVSKEQCARGHREQRTDGISADAQRRAADRRWPRMRGIEQILFSDHYGLGLLDEQCRVGGPAEAAVLGRTETIGEHVGEQTQAQRRLAPSGEPSQRVYPA